MFSLTRVNDPNAIATAHSVRQMLHIVAHLVGGRPTLLCNGASAEGFPEVVGMFSGDTYCPDCFKDALLASEHLHAILTLLRSVVLQ